MSGTFGEMGNLLKQAQQMQRELDRAREELRTTLVRGSAGGGAVQVEVSGEGMLVRIQIAPETVAGGDAPMLEDLVLAAVRDGLAKAAALREERLAKVSAGLHLPGMF
jgi:DNA-binding YbaB/EbfC family protein